MATLTAAAASALLMRMESSFVRGVVRWVEVGA